MARRTRNHPRRSDASTRHMEVLLPDLPYAADEQYFAGFGQSRMRRYETDSGGGFGVEWYTDTEGDATVTLYRPADLQEAARRSIARGGGVLDLSTDRLAESAPRVVLRGDIAERMTVGEARRRLAEARRA